MAIGYGCKKESSQIEQVRQTSLLKTKWILSYIQDTKTNERINYPNDDTKKIFIIFTDSLNTLLFSGVCNSGQGLYSFSSSNDSLNVNGVGTTKIACINVVWEEYVVTNLTDAYHYKIIDNTLVIYSRGAYNLYFNN
jgi:hypothetical protein